MTTSRVVPERTELLPKDYSIPDLGVPTYVTNRYVIERMFDYLITKNLPVNTGPGYALRLERTIILGGKRYGHARSIEKLSYPLLSKQTITNVSEDADDKYRILQDLEKEGLFQIGSAHNHPAGIEMPSPDDIESHMVYENAGVQHLTVVVLENGEFSFWRPNYFEVFIDGERLPVDVIPHQNKYMKFYRFK